MIDLRLKYGSNNVPIIKNCEIDEHAEALIQDYNSQLLLQPQAIDVEDFAENYLGLHFHYTNLSHNGFIWGRMVFNNTKILSYDSNKKCIIEEAVEASTIIIDNSLLDERQEHAFRSTVMHESGHAIYHDEYYYVDYYQLPLEKDNEVEHMPYTTCEKKDIAGNKNAAKKLRTDKDWIEHQAKYFSAAMLMPRKTMQMLTREPAVRKICFDKSPGHENEALVVIVSRVFNVSLESAQIRIKELGLNYIS